MPVYTLILLLIVMAYFTITLVIIFLKVNLERYTLCKKCRETKKYKYDAYVN